MIKNIVLDMGNVCCLWDVDYIASKLTDIQDKQELLKDKVFGSPAWAKLDKGIISIEDAKKEMMASVEDEDKELVNFAVDHWHDHFIQIDKMELLVKELKEKGYKLFLLSNCSVQFYDYYQKRSIFSYLDDIYISADHKMVKPDREIYVDFLKTFSLKAEECLFIDDVKVNIDSAILCGMNGIVFDGNVEKLKDAIYQR